MSSLLQSCKKYFGSKDLYKVLKISKDASEKEIRKAYHKLSLQVHPDKVEGDDKEDATEKFQVLGKVYSILSNNEKKAIYDETGTVDDEDDGDDSVDWLDFWRKLFKPVTVKDIQDYEKTYIGSDKEKEDLKKAYIDGKGDMDFILESVPFTSVDEEPRLRAVLQDLIDQDQVPAFKQFTNEPSRKRDRRKRKYEKEAKEADKATKEQQSGVNDLAMAILKNQEERNGSFLDKLEAKYGSKAGSSKTEKTPKSKGRKK